MTTLAFNGLMSCTLLRYAEKEKYTKFYVYFHKKFFPQAYLIWAPKLIVSKIGIMLSKRT